MSGGLQVGLGLWSMRATAYAPSSWPQLYAELRDDARLAEELGYDALWLAEHHVWYDGWCPQPLVAAASCLAATGRLRIGTAMHLLPQHGIDRVSADLGTLLDCFGDRVDLGVSLGYRDEEYDAVGVPRTRRGRLMEEQLDRLLADHADRWQAGIPIYVGGIAEPAIRRAGRRGLSLLLPNSLAPSEVDARRTMADEESQRAGVPTGRLGLLVDVWICPDAAMAARVRERLVLHYREYAGAWFRLRGEPAFARPDLLDKQSARTREVAVVGTEDEVVEQLVAMRQAGVDTLVLQVRADLYPSAYRDAMRVLADKALPAVRAVG